MILGEAESSSVPDPRGVCAAAVSTERNTAAGAAAGHRICYSLLELLGGEVSHPRDRVGLDSSLSEVSCWEAEQGIKNV